MRLRYQRADKPIDIYPVEQKISMKPDGLWYSVGTEWKDWCKSEDFRTGKDFEAEYELEIDESKILLLQTELEIREFNDSYGYVGPHGRDIDWVAVARDYSGIEIAPYQWSLRLDEIVSWYYSWDVASGCIWAQDAITDVRRVQ